MKTRTRLGAWMGALVLLAAGSAAVAEAVSVTWDGSGDTDWGPPPDGTSWSGGTYNDGDTAVFAGDGQGTVSVDSNGVAPSAIGVTAGSYTFAGGNIAGSGGLTNSGSGTVAVGYTYTGLVYTGETRLNSGILRIDHNSSGGGPVDRSLGGTSVLNGGTLRLQHTGAGHNNPDMTFTGGVEVTAAGGTIDYAGSANDFGDNIVGPLTLGGALTVSGITGNSGIRFNLTAGGITLITNAAITNATGSGGYAHTISLSPNISGSSHTLTLEKSGNGTGFEIYGPTASSIDLANLVLGTGGSLGLLDVGSGVDPLNQVHTVNSGQLTVGDGATLSYRPTVSVTPLLDPTAFTWSGNGTLNFPRASGGNGDSYVRFINGDLTVSAATGLTHMNAMPWRAYYTIDSPYAIIVGDGGTLQWTAGSQVRETVRGNMTFLDGATIVGVNSSGNPGGLIRDTTGGGTFTLGDGSAATVTVEGDHGTDPDSFNLGWPAANVTDNGNVTMHYANTSATAGNYFNVGWSDGGAYSAALTAFRETSGGTEFAPLAGSGGVAIVGPSSGTVATFAKTGTVTTAGTVGFYNEINTNQRGTPGEVVVASGGLLTITNDVGTVEAGTLTVDGGTVSGVGTFSVTDAAFTNGGVYSVVITGAASTACGQITASGTLTFLTGGTLAIDTNAYAPNATEFWDIATAGTIADLPSVPAGWSVQDLSGTLRLTKLASATAAVIENRAVSDVTGTSATFNGFLHSTGSAATVVTLYWGETDKGDTSVGWDETNDFGERGVAALITNLTTLTQDRYYYYRFKADNGEDAWDAEGGESFITGDITVTGTTDGEEVGPVTGVFTLSRGSVLTNEDLVVTYEMNGSATEGVDYEAPSGVVTILQGQASAAVDIVPIPDPDVEGNETVWLSLLAGPYDSSALASNSIQIIDRPAADLEWTDGAATGAWNTNDLNWTDGSPAKFSGGDNVTFGGTAQGTVTVDAGGVTPGSIAVTNGSYAFAGGDITGSGGLNKSGSGTITVGYTYSGLDYTGDTRIDEGIVRIDHNIQGGGPVDRSLGGTTVLNGGTLRLNHTGAGWAASDMTFTNGLQVTANGGTLDYAGGANDFGDNYVGPLTLGGPLTVSGITGNTGIRFNLTSGGITLNTDASITNATGSGGNAHTIALSPDISGPTRTLTLDKSGNGTGFLISGATGSSIDIAGLSVGAGSSLSFLSVANGVNPLSQIKSNGGMLTMGTGSSLGFPTTTSANGPILDPTAVVWQGGNTLTINLSGVGNQDSFVRIANGDLTVSTASGLTQLNARPWRAYYTIDSPNALIVGDGGTLNYTVGSTVRETVRGNMTFLDGATIVGMNSSGNAGGIIRDPSGGTLTLGDGSASTVTVQGNQGTDPDSFNLGWPAANVTDSGNVTMRYANTSATAGNFFNVGWSDGGAYSAALTAFRETSGGTEFAPLAGSGGVAIVGPSSGTVATFANAVTVSSGGTVGFYNEVNVNQRGALGAVVAANGGSLSLQTNGTVQASDVTFESGAEWGVTLYSEDAGEAGSLDTTGALTFDSGSELVVTHAPSFSGGGGPWTVATFGSRSGLPDVSGGYALTVDGSTLVLEVLPPGTLFSIR